MIDIENKNHQPSEAELSSLVSIPLFDELFKIMDSEYKAIRRTEYSCDKVLLGWNVKFKKGGRTLCTVYPRSGHFCLLLVVGNKEKERVESAMSGFSDDFRNIYKNTREGMGQRWMIFDLFEHTPVFDDILKVVRIRRESK